MNKAIRSEVRHYLKSVKGKLPCSFSAKAAFAGMLRSQINDFLNEFPDAGIDDVIEHFGTPETIASEFDVNDYVNEIKRYKKKTIVLIILSVVLLIGCVFLTILLSEAIEDYHIIINDDYPG